jgi:5-methylcytosine-specific restriction endonuclease McrA
MFELPTSRSLKRILGYSSREPIPADKKRAVRERARNKCEVCHKKPYGVTLEFHHKNMRNSDNRLSNLQLLCPNHHRLKHSRARRKVTTDELGRTHSRIVKKKQQTKSKTKPRKKKTSSPFDINLQKTKFPLL